MKIVRIGRSAMGSSFTSWIPAYLRSVHRGGVSRRSGVKNYPPAPTTQQSVRADEEDFDRALFRAAWIQGQDVNDESVIRHAAQSVGLDADHLLQRALDEEAKRAAREALNTFDRDQVPGVPTWVVNGKRFWGKDRVEWVVQEVKHLLDKYC